MMPRTRRILIGLLKIADLSVVVASFLAAVVFVGAAEGTGRLAEFLDLRITLVNVLFLLVYFAYWHVVFRACNLYSSYRLSPASRELRDLVVAVVIGVAPLPLLRPSFHFDYITVRFLFTFTVLVFVGLGLERRLLRALGRQVRRYGRNLRNVIFVGTGDEAFGLTSRLARREDLGYQVAAILEVGSANNGNGAGRDHRHIVRQVESLIEQRPIDEVFVALPLDKDQELIHDLVNICEQQGIMVRLVAQVAALNWAHAVIDSLDGQPVFTLCTGPTDEWRLLIKRAIDIGVATVGLLVCAPLFLIASIAVKLDSPGPVFFMQERVGYKRRRFRAFKFRTMVNGAERLQETLEPLNEAKGPVFKIHDDPRITRVGRWLRRTSVDELPQLINVLKGEMSLVGPRPLPLRDVARIDVRWHKRRFSIKPGITCLWQANRREPNFDEWIRSDMEYIDNWSLGLDFKILAKTIPAVLSTRGAQ